MESITDTVSRVGVAKFVSIDSIVGVSTVSILGVVSAVGIVTSFLAQSVLALLLVVSIRIVV